jgi:Cyclic nucleotide-binding domain
MSVRLYQAGDVILQENDTGETAYIIKRGRVEVTKELHGQNIHIAFMGAGDIFGEMSIIDDKPRSATVIAIEETEVSEFHREEFFHGLHTDPDMALQLLRGLFERLRDAHITILQYHYLDRLYGELLERGVNYFFPTGRLTVLGPIPASRPVLTYRAQQGTVLELEWLRARYAFSRPGKPFTEHENRLLKSIGHVLSSRYHLLFHTDLAAQSFHLFRGLSEDRYVSAFLDQAPYSCVEALPHVMDRVAEAIEVLRVSALTTYEDRRIITGVLLYGAQPDPYHPLPSPPPDALPYSSALTSIRSFHRLSDALQTVALVDQDGLLVEIIDIQQWAQPFADAYLPVPSTTRYQAHSRATLGGDHICLILTPNGEIKAFANGAQVFNFIDGRWRLTDAVEKYRLWEHAIGDSQLAERLFTAALNLAEYRRGGLFVVLDDARLVENLVVTNDLLSYEHRPSEVHTPGAKEQLHYLLRHKRVLDIAPTVLETLARIDGAIVLDREANLLAFGTILRHPLARNERVQATEGGRTTAALAASWFGNVLKISEDGLIAFFQQGECVWEM